MATPTTLAELAPFWRADDNEGVSLESVSKEIAAYKPGGTFAEDYAAFVQLLQVVAHPKVGAVAIAKPGDKAEGEEKAENSRVGVRNHVVDVGTAKCLSCAPPRGASHPGAAAGPAPRAQACCRSTSRSRSSSFTTAAWASRPSSSSRRRCPGASRSRRRRSARLRADFGAGVVGSRAPRSARRPRANRPTVGSVDVDAAERVTA